MVAASARAVSWMMTFLVLVEVTRNGKRHGARICNSACGWNAGRRANALIRLRAGELAFGADLQPCHFSLPIATGV